MRVLLPGSVSLLLAILTSTAAQALEPSGQAVAVIQATSASGPGGERALAAAKPVYSGDRINTGPKGEAQIRFRDETKLVIGGNSSVVIDQFVFNSDRTVANVGIALTKGALRFITGSGPKNAYVLETPTATLGIRGTRFDLAVSPEMGTGVVVFDGAVEMCSPSSGECTIVDSACGAAVASPNGSLGSPASKNEAAALIAASFPLVSKQTAFLPDFRVDTGACPVISVPQIEAPAAPTLRKVDLDIPEATNTGAKPVREQESVRPPPSGPVTGPSSGPPVTGSISPGSSGRASGGIRSASSSASEKARSNPGKSGSSKAGGKKGGGKNDNKKSKGKGKNKR